MTSNELRRKGQAVVSDFIWQYWPFIYSNSCNCFHASFLCFDELFTVTNVFFFFFSFKQTLFIMATFSPCFVGEIESARSSCPAKAKCSSVYGMCVCMPDYFKNGTACISHNLRNRQYATEVNEYFDSNVHVSKKIQNHSNKSNEEHQKTDSLSSTLPMLSNISTTSCSITTLKTVTSRTSTEDVDLIASGPKNSELQTTMNKHQRHMPSTEKMNSFESISTTPMYTKPTKGRLDSTSSTSSYIPWQMKFWKRVTV